MWRFLAMPQREGALVLEQCAGQRAGCFGGRVHKGKATAAGALALQEVELIFLSRSKGFKHQQASTQEPGGHG